MIGECVIRDGMVEVYGKMRDCDAIVLASPIYFHHVTAQTKLFLDRLYSFVDVRNERWSRLTRSRPGAVILTHENCDLARYFTVGADLAAVLDPFSF